MSLILVVLPFVSSAFVPAGSMPAGVRWFAEYQPFTPVIQTLRGLLTGTPIGTSAIAALAWCAGIAAAGYLWARARYDRGAARPLIRGQPGRCALWPGRATGHRRMPAVRTTAAVTWSRAGSGRQGELDGCKHSGRGARPLH